MSRTATKPDEIVDAEAPPHSPLVVAALFGPSSLTQARP